MHAQQSALTKANGFCLDKGLVFVPNTMKSANENGYGVRTGYTVTFMCLTKDDPRLKHYSVQDAPDVVIERRER